MQGVIATKTEQGYGFIKVEGGAKDIFFHSNELVGVDFDSLQVGDQVTFEMADGPKGPYAAGVKKV